jgi:hypothetical protein
VVKNKGERNGWLGATTMGFAGKYLVSVGVSNQD